MVHTYSFTDHILTLSHPKRGSKVMTGDGLGGLTIAFANDNTAIEVGADGYPVISKINVENGTATITTPQGSLVSEWLRQTYLYLKQAPSYEWAQIKGVLQNIHTRRIILLNDAAFQKPADDNFQQTAQQESWALIVSKIVL